MKKSKSENPYMEVLETAAGRSCPEAAEVFHPDKKTEDQREVSHGETGKSKTLKEGKAHG